MSSDYSRQKAERQRLAAAWRPGQPVPRIAYTAGEDELWQTVTGKLRGLHAETACAEYLRAAQVVMLPEAHVPALSEVSLTVQRASGFCLWPAPGTVPASRFLGAFADGVFQATQYLRSAAHPFHTPEPDLIHELIGHAVMLADAGFARLYRRFGLSARRASSDLEVRELSQLFWFTMETGVVLEHGAPRAYGAALLSSVAELETLGRVELRPFDAARVLRQDYDDREQMPFLFAVDSVDQLAAALDPYLASA